MVMRAESVAGRILGRLLRLMLSGRKRNRISPSNLRGTGENRGLVLERDSRRRELAGDTQRSLKTE